MDTQFRHTFDETLDSLQNGNISTYRTAIKQLDADCLLVDFITYVLALNYTIDDLKLSDYSEWGQE